MKDDKLNDEKHKLKDEEQKVSVKEEAASKAPEPRPEIRPEIKPESKDAKKDTKAELQELTELLKRTQANFENYRKQTERRVEELRQIAAKDLILELLPVLDNFELALKTSCSDLGSLRKGIELIYAQLFQVLESHGLQPIIVEKQKFNPYQQEALMKVESDLPENTVVEELQKGYALADKVIRHAKVKISAGKKQAQK